MLKFIITILLFISSNSFAVSQKYIDEAFKEASEAHNVPLNLLKSICWVESNHLPHSYNYGDASLHNHAFGLCQILYHTAKRMGLNDDRCEHDFRHYTPDERTYSNACKLFGPKTNAFYAAKYLRMLLDRYNGNEFRAVLSYNSGSYINCSSGFLHYNEIQENGTYKRIKFKRCLIDGPANLYYATKVLKRLEEIWRKTNAK